MGFTCRFLHNQVYSAQEVNQAFSRLTSQGVSLFSDTGNPLTDLNTAVSNLVTDGIELDYDACKVVSAGGGSYKVMPGTAIMPNGEMITVDTDGYTFTAGTGTAWDVVMAVEANQGIIRAQTADAPANGILIAQISAAGAVTDRRTFATTKVAPSTGNIYREYSIPDTTLTSSMGGTVLETFDAGSPWFQYILVTNKDGKAVSGGHQKLTEGVKTEFMKANPNDETINSVLLSFQKRGQNIDIYAKIEGVGASTHSLQFLVF